MNPARHALAPLFLAVFLAPAVADDGVSVGQDGAGRLVGRIDIAQPHRVPASVFPGFDGFATGDFGFSNTQIDIPANGFYMLSLESSIQANVVAIDHGLDVYDGMATLAVGSTITFGPPFFDYHPFFHIHDPGQTVTLTLVLHDASMPQVYADSEPIVLAFVADACPADVGVQGGVEGQDGVLDNNDFIVFIDMFFAGEHAADRGVQGGVPGHDETLDNNDFIVFIDQFFTGC